MEKDRAVRRPICLKWAKENCSRSPDYGTNGRIPRKKSSKAARLLTTTPNILLANIHDRMPVIVTPDKYDLWLNPEVEDFDAVREILKPYDPGLMSHYPVNQRVNHVQNDDADCAAPTTPELPAQTSFSDLALLAEADSRIYN